MQFVSDGLNKIILYQYFAMAAYVFRIDLKISYSPKRTRKTLTDVKKSVSGHIMIFL